MLPGTRERLLLAYLALSPNCRQPRSKLATLFWPGTAGDHAANNLRTSLWRLRSALGDPNRQTVASDGDHLVLDVSAFDIDVLAFSSLAGQQSRSALESASDLYCAEFLAGLAIDGEELETWHRGEAIRFRDLALDALSRLMIEQSECGETAKAIEVGLRILNFESLHEPTARRLMQLYGRSGRRAAAIQLYRQLNDALRLQVGAEPEPETNDVFNNIACGVVSAVREQERSISIAVLPFANLTGATSDEYLSEGMTEELVTALAKSSRWRVVARGSASRFKGTTLEMRKVGEALAATHLIEGSVRKSGTRLRITARLIRAHDSTNIWTGTYDRNLTDVIAIQDDIATAIARSLAVPLGLPADRLVSNWGDDPETYRAYLRGRALVRSRAVDQAIETLEKLVARAPRHAPSWAMLSQAYRSALDYTPITRTAPVQEAKRFVFSSLDKAEAAARKAIQLDPRHCGGYAALGYIQTPRGRWLEADALFRRALGLDPNDPETLYRYSQTLALVGRVEDALRNLERLRALEPFIPVYNVLTAQTMQLAGQCAASAQLLESVQADTRLLYFRNLYLARAYAAFGRFADAADALLSIRNAPQVSTQSVQAAARLIGKASVTRAPVKMRALEADLNFVYAYVGSSHRLFEQTERELEIGDSTVTNVWVPTWKPLRKTERFKKYIRDSGMLAYWRSNGWADMYRPLGKDDFTCN